jgi:hypothetical protein
MSNPVCAKCGCPESDMVHDQLSGHVGLRWHVFEPLPAPKDGTPLWMWRPGWTEGHPVRLTPESRPPADALFFALPAPPAATERKGEL